MTVATPGTLTLLHTAPANVAAFERLVAEVAPGVPVRHILAADLLDDARAHGITPDLRDRVAAQVNRAIDDGAEVVLCTCSSIGGCAEEATIPPHATVLRVDRAMAERAVATGARIGIAAALESTLGPTEELLQAVAAEADRPVTLSRIVCTEAWTLFEAGDREGFYAAIANTIRFAASGLDVIVLAQASMAGAAPLLGDLGVPVLSSPRLGLESALAMLGR